MSTIATKLHDLVDHIYAIGIPKQDNFLLILLMNAMSSEFTTLQNHVADCINASTVVNPYTLSYVFKRLKMEQQIINSEKQRQSLLALAATMNKPHHMKGHSTKTCSNCGGTGHTNNKCWKEGGGCAGQRDAILTEKQAAHAARGTKDKLPAAKPSTNTTTMKPSPSLCYNTSGRAYILDSASSEAVFVAQSTTMAPAVNPTPPNDSVASCAFAGLTYDLIMPAFIRDAMAEDLAEYEALFSAMDAMTTVDWCTHSHNIALASLTYKV